MWPVNESHESAFILCTNFLFKFRNPIIGYAKKGEIYVSLPHIFGARTFLHFAFMLYISLDLTHGVLQHTLNP